MDKTEACPCGWALPSLKLEHLCLSKVARFTVLLWCPKCGARFRQEVEVSAPGPLTGASVGQA